MIFELRYVVLLITDTVLRLREMMEMVVTILDGKLERKIFFFFPLSEDASLF